MLLKSRELVIEKDDLFKNEKLNRKGSGNTLTHFVMPVNDSVFICVDALDKQSSEIYIIFNWIG